MTQTDQQSVAGKDDTLDRILSEAARLFAEQGFKGMSMSQLAEACQLTKPAIYYYFRDKQELYTQVLVQHSMQHHRVIDQRVAGKNTRAALKEIVHYLRTNPIYDLEDMMSDIATNLDAERQAIVAESFRRDIFGPTHALFEAGIGSGELRPDTDPVVSTWMFMSAASVFCQPHARARVSIPDYAADGRSVVDVLVDTMLDGISNKQEA